MHDLHRFYECVTSSPQIHTIVEFYELVNIILVKLPSYVLKRFNNLRQMELWVSLSFHLPTENTAFEL